MCKSLRAASLSTHEITAVLMERKSEGRIVARAQLFSPTLNIVPNDVGLIIRQQDGRCHPTC